MSYHLPIYIEVTTTLNFVQRSMVQDYKTELRNRQLQRIETDKV